MRKKLLIKILGIFSIINILFILSLNENYRYMNEVGIKQIEKSKESKVKLELAKMSRLLTNSMKIMGQLSCKISVNQVSNRGGWCANMTGLNSTVMYYFDGGFAQVLGQVLYGKRAVSFGEGPGTYKEFLENQKLIKLYDAFDGAPFVEEKTNKSVSFIDLTVPIYHLSEYDWVVSIEVAEHIPPQFESIYLDNLVRHANEGVILSWAHPGQVGHSHVNNRPAKYVKQQMKKRGFSYDGAITNRLRRSAYADWIRKNVNVFRRDYFI